QRAHLRDLDRPRSPTNAIRATVRPVHALAVTDGSAEKFVDRDLERATLRSINAFSRAPMAWRTIPPAAGRRSACMTATCASKGRGSLPISVGPSRSIADVTPRPPKDSLYSLQPTRPVSAVTLT